MVIKFLQQFQLTVFWIKEVSEQLSLALDFASTEAPEMASGLLFPLGSLQCPVTRS